MKDSLGSFKSWNIYLYYILFVSLKIKYAYVQVVLLPLKYNQY